MTNGSSTLDPLVFLTAPNQYHSFGTWLVERRNLVPPSLSVRCFHIHSKTALQNRRKLWVSAGFLFARVVWEWGQLWFRHRVFSPSCIRSQPFPSPPAPKTHPVSPFLAQIGCVFLFFAAFWPQNFRLGFCATCRIASTS